MLLYSHIWDGLLKLLSLVGLIIAALSLKVVERIESTGVLTESVSVSIMIAAVCVAWLILYRQYLSIISTWLYARMRLRTNVTFSEAKALRKLFQLDLSGKWLPMREIKKLPNHERHQALLLALGNFGPGRKAMLF
jgi:hypothetical protein